MIWREFKLGKIVYLGCTLIYALLIPRLETALHTSSSLTDGWPFHKDPRVERTSLATSTGPLGAYKIRGQLIAYGTALHRSQFRFFSFSVALFGNTGRLLQWGRSGVIYKERFKWADWTVFEFLRFNFLSDMPIGLRVVCRAGVVSDAKGSAQCFEEPRG